MLYKILLTSALKTVAEPRMYEKIGRSVSAIPNHEVHIFGRNESQNDFYVDNNISLHPHSVSGRNFTARLKILFQFIALFLKLKPKVLITAVPEHALFCALLPFFKTALIYDLRVNYSLNIISQQQHAKNSKNLKLKLLSVVEKIIFKKSVQIFMAESVYQAQFPEIKHKSIVLENKVRQPEPFVEKTEANPIKQFLFTGTISEEFGIFDVLKLFKKISSFWPKAQLTIAGYCGNLKTRQLLYSEVKKWNNIQLIGISKHVNHQQIEQLIQSSDFGLLAYQNLACFHGKVPTKLREYMAYKLPIIGKDVHSWNTYIAQNHAGTYFDWDSISEEKLQYELEKWFYPVPIDPDFLFWDSYNRIITETITKYSTP